MKVHYINILLLALPLNILVYNQWNHKSTTPHPTPSTRLLCECELYEPANYDNDQEMKRVMENFNRQTSQRFKEYDERLQSKRKKCKEQCDKEIQKIILKDKLEKELMDKFATLHTDIQSDAIPTCVCEKSLADKVEKGCLRCTQNLGGIVAPSSGVLAGIGEAA
ncbi:rifin, partial [Plasmodium reichenowi]